MEKQKDRVQKLVVVHLGYFVIRLEHLQNQLLVVTVVQLQ